MQPVFEIFLFPSRRAAAVLFAGAYIFTTLVMVRFAKRLSFFRS